MTSKRKHDGEHTAGNASAKKKQRTDEARTIAVQRVSFVASANATGSTGNASSNSMAGLPSAIDVEKFAEARAFEINAMQDAMENASAGATHRAWQTLPRHLRRRAASHDVRRVPARLRDKARAEMDTPKKTTKKKLPKRGKAKAIPRTEALLKRQVNKSWLETHIWHAKRMKMENMWGYRLAITPTEKAYRPSHRASVHGSILHDASYEAIVEVKGPEAVLRTVFNECCDPQAAGPGAARFLSGSRVCYTHMYKPKSFPFDYIGPVHIMWCPKQGESPNVNRDKHSKGKGKAKEVVPPQTLPVDRCLWIRCHPLQYEDVFSALQSCVQNYLLRNQSEGQKEFGVEVADLRNHFNIFELVGPKSSQIIHGALKLAKEESRQELKQFWAALANLQSAGSAPRGMVIGCEVMDPRLAFPPKNAKVHIEKHALPDVRLPDGLWPKASLATCDIWDETARDKLSKPKFKKKDIDARKSKHLVPGSKLKPLRQDDRVPILLIQRSIEEQNPSSPSSINTSRPMHGWTIIAPKGWGMPFFLSLTHTGTRVAGQHEIKTQSFEAGCLHFPHDLPCTPAYEIHVDEREKTEREKWERKPPAKRASWDKLETRSPWKPDWEVVLGLKPPEPADPELITTQRENEEVANEASLTPQMKPWLLRGPGMPALVQYMTHSNQAALDLLTKVNEMRAKGGLPDLSVQSEDLLGTALITARLLIPRSGSPDDNAIIYKMPDTEIKKWQPLLDRGEGDFTEAELSELKGSSGDIIGYVTSGHYSLSIGRGHGVGAVSLKGYVLLVEQLHRIQLAMSLPIVKIRNRHSTICRVARLELMF